MIRVTVRITKGSKTEHITLKCTKLLFFQKDFFKTQSIVTAYPASALKNESFAIIYSIPNFHSMG